MKALILNSGIGKRMGELTKDRNKCMAEISDGVAIIDWQLNLLQKIGIKDVVVTTGPFAEKLKAYVTARHPGVHFVFCHNPDYDKTNYIYSIALAQEALRDDDILLMHGDLVFEESVLRDIAESPASAMVIDRSLQLPEKDFKAVVQEERITKVGIEFFENAYAAQPLYKLLKNDWNVWLDEILAFCQAGNRGVYAENALNEISGRIRICPYDVDGRLCAEVDDLDDLANVRRVAERVSAGGQK